MNEAGFAAGHAKPPLAGITVIEMAAIGPVPLAGLMLAEMGARVVRIDRLADKEMSFLGLPGDLDYTRHGRSIVKVDLKRPEGRDLVLALLEKSDILIEGFRPGVMERFGLGPDIALERNPRLIYGRLTGFGQEGPMAQRAGHDLTYLAYSGVLNAIGIKGSRPVPPLNLVGDYGGGTMFLIAGLLAALVERATSGKGQVVDATMIDGILGLAMPVFAYMAAGQWRDRRASNLLDTGAPFYDTYETADGLHVAVGCLEPQFFATFAKLLPLEDRFVSRQYDASSWPDMRQAIAARFKTRSREEWTALFEPSDACVAPVLDFDEARLHPHNIARETHIAVGSLTRPAPAPRLSRSPLRPAGHAQADILETLRAFGVPNAETAISDGICA